MNTQETPPAEAERTGLAEAIGFGVLGGVAVMEAADFLFVPPYQATVLGVGAALFTVLRSRIASNE